MKYKNLGSNNTQISSIGLGTNFITEIPRDQKKLIYLLQKALDNSINLFDTAEIYHNGYSEKLIGKAFKNKREKVFISSKFSAEHCSYREVLKACEGSLKRLQTDYIDLYQIHWPNPIVPIEDTLKALEKLVEVGKIKYIGVSNFSLRQLKDAQRVSKLPIVSLQTEYNLLERSVENEILPFCERNKITLIAYTPLNSGNILKNEKYSKIFLNLSEKYKKTASQIILNFLTSHKNVIIIPATTSLVHLEENAKSADFLLEEKDIKLISKIFTSNITNIATWKIRISTIANQAIYKTLEEALANRLNFFPSPKILSEDIKKGDFLKPVRVRAILKKKDNFEYELLGGRIRYWAWVITYNGKKPIPAIIED